MIAKELESYPQARTTSVLPKLEIAPATYYRELKGAPAKMSIHAPALPWPNEWILAVKEASKKHPTYGYRMIWGLLKKHVPKKAVRKLMKRCGLVQGRKECVHAKRDLSKLKRPEGVNQVWQMD